MIGQQGQSLSLIFSLLVVIVVGVVKAEGENATDNVDKIVLEATGESDNKPDLVLQSHLKSKEFRQWVEQQEERVVEKIMEKIISPNDTSLHLAAKYAVARYLVNVTFTAMTRRLENLKSGKKQGFFPETAVAATAYPTSSEPTVSIVDKIKWIVNETQHNIDATSEPTTTKAPITTNAPTTNPTISTSQRAPQEEALVFKGDGEGTNLTSSLPSIGVATSSGFPASSDVDSQLATSTGLNETETTTVSSGKEKPLWEEILTFNFSAALNGGGDAQHLLNRINGAEGAGLLSRLNLTALRGGNGTQGGGNLFERLNLTALAGGGGGNLFERLNLTGMGGGNLFERLNLTGGGNLLERLNLTGMGGGNLFERLNLTGMGGGNLFERLNLTGPGGGNLFERLNLTGMGGGNLFERLNLTGMGGGNLFERLNLTGGGNLLERLNLTSSGGGNLFERLNLTGPGGGNLFERLNLTGMGGGNLFERLNLTGGGNLLERLNLTGGGGGNLLERLNLTGGGNLLERLNLTGGGGSLLERLNLTGGGNGSLFERLNLTALGGAGGQGGLPFVIEPPQEGFLNYPTPPPMNDSVRLSQMILGHQVEMLMGNINNSNLTGIVESTINIATPSTVGVLVNALLNILLCNPLDRFNGNCGI